ncbi:hypothetical protein [Gimesia algae]|uniref:hypothetical protein n=1 Tax=Gimesia algae TaxID=2527971 RepID=UPI00119DADBF|nr:hypothetical protein [Gimesia algae]
MILVWNQSNLFGNETQGIIADRNDCSKAKHRFRDEVAVGDHQLHSANRLYHKDQKNSEERDGSADDECPVTELPEAGRVIGVLVGRLVICVHSFMFCDDCSGGSRLILQHHNLDSPRGFCPEL